MNVFPVHFSANIFFCSEPETQPKIFNQMSVTGVHKLWGPGRRGDYISYVGA
jgi:hypothetical protein